MSHMFNLHNLYDPRRKRTEVGLQLARANCVSRIIYIYTV